MTEGGHMLLMGNGQRSVEESSGNMARDNDGRQCGWTGICKREAEGCAFCATEDKQASGIRCPGAFCVPARKAAHVSGVSGHSIGRASYMHIRGF